MKKYMLVSQYEMSIIEVDAVGRTIVGSMVFWTLDFIERTYLEYGKRLFIKEV